MLQVDTGTGVLMGYGLHVAGTGARPRALTRAPTSWSLGVVLYEILSGAHPFKGETQRDLIVSILERDRRR